MRLTWRAELLTARPGLRRSVIDVATCSALAARGRSLARFKCSNGRVCVKRSHNFKIKNQAYEASLVGTSLGENATLNKTTLDKIIMDLRAHKENELSPRFRELQIQNVLRRKCVLFNPAHTRR